MKKQVILILLMSMILSLSGCVNLYNGKRPGDYGAAIWISDDPDIWFEVPEISDDNERKETFSGELTYDGKVIPINVAFNYGRTVFIFKSVSEGGMLFNGSCSFSPEKMVVHVEKKSDIIFKGSYDQIVFTRTK